MIRLALTRKEAAEAIGLSLDHFEKHVQHEIRLVQRGRRIVVPVSELEAWLERNAERVLDPTKRRPDDDPTRRPDR